MSRLPPKFRDQVLTQFRSRENTNYLAEQFKKHLPPGKSLDYVLETLRESVYNYERAEELVNFDPFAQRGASVSGANLWTEVKRLNRAFFSDKINFIKEKQRLIEDRPDEDEPLYYRMFVADSLRPPGAEMLNDYGPRHEIRERRVEYGGGVPSLEPRGAPRQSNEEKIANSILDYWRYGKESRLGAGMHYPHDKLKKEPYRDSHGNDFNDMHAFIAPRSRYPSIGEIPYLMKKGREGQEKNISEALNCREFGNHIRRMDLSRMRDPRGEEYRRYGWRT